MRIHYYIFKNLVQPISNLQAPKQQVLLSLLSDLSPQPEGKHTCNQHNSKSNECSFTHYVLDSQKEVFWPRVFRQQCMKSDTFDLQTVLPDGKREKQNKTCFGRNKGLTKIQCFSKLLIHNSKCIHTDAMQGVQTSAKRVQIQQGFLSYQVTVATSEPSYPGKSRFPPGSTGNSAGSRPLLDWCGHPWHRE